MALTCISHAKGDRKIKVNRKDKFEVEYLFQNFEALTPHADIINPNIGQKCKNW